LLYDSLLTQTRSEIVLILGTKVNCFFPEWTLRGFGSALFYLFCPRDSTYVFLYDFLHFDDWRIIEVGNDNASTPVRVTYGLDN